MKRFKYYIVRLFMLLCFSLFIVSCEDETSTIDIPGQLFRPVDFKAAINANTAKISWLPIANASYVLEISRDSFLFERDFQTFSLDGVDEYAIEDLWSVSRYSARIKAISKVGDIKNSEYNQITFVTGAENTFYALKDNDISFNSVNLKWDNKKSVDKIIVSSAGTPDVTVTLSAEDKAAGEKLIKNLKPATNYTFIIYLGEMPRGSISAVTYTNFSTVIVDQTKAGGAWFGLGTYYFKAGAGAYVEIRTDNTVGVVIADAFKFSKEGFADIIVDNTDPSVVVIGAGWGTASSSTIRIGADYYWRGTASVPASVRYIPNLPLTGRWTVSMYWNGNSSRANNVPVDIFAGN